MKLVHIIGLIGCILIPIVAGSPYEVCGRVIHVIDGDTFDFEVQDSDRALDNVIRVGFADIDCPEIRGPKACPEDEVATEYARS
jgi:endonuclease YncB( thermonuclease family)